MYDRSRLRRDVIILLIGAAIGALFGVIVAYPEILASTRENAVRIEANRVQIEQLWDAHEIRHEGPDPDGG